MTVSKSQQRAVNKYVRNNYDRINVTFPKGSKSILRAAADLHGESVNAYIARAVADALEHDGLTLPKPTSMQDISDDDADPGDDADPLP